jgi:hypothetical protein
MQFVDLWALINILHLQDNVDDNIIWKFTDNGLYSAAFGIQDAIPWPSIFKHEHYCLEGMGTSKG